MVTLERVVAVIFPHKAKLLFTQIRVKLSVVIAFIFLCLIYIPIIFTYYFEDGFCYSDLDGIMAEYTLWAINIFKIILPLGLVFSL